ASWRRTDFQSVRLPGRIGNPSYHGKPAHPAPHDRGWHAPSGTRRRTMARRQRPEVPEEAPASVLERARPPVAVGLGSPGEVARLVAALGGADVTCYQMDLYQAERLRGALDEKGLPGRVVTAPDLWDLPADFQTVLYPAARGSERSLKIDMVE